MVDMYPTTFSDSMDAIEPLFVKFEITEYSPNFTTMFFDFDYDLYKDNYPDLVGFNIYFAPTSDELPIKINTGIVDSNYFIHKRNAFAKIPRAYYLIEGVGKDGKIYRSQLFDTYCEPHNDTKILLQNELYGLMAPTALSFFPALLYFLRRTGENCPKCVGAGNNVRKGQAGMGDCQVCYGTSFVGGYYKPTISFISYNTPIQETLVNTEDGMESSVRVNIRSSGYFGVIKPKDYIREFRPPNRIWIVEMVTKSESLGRPVSYNMDCTQLSISSRLYTKPLPVIKLPKMVYYDTVLNDYDSIKNSVTENIPEQR